MCTLQLAHQRLYFFLAPPAVQLAHESGAQAVFFSQLYDPVSMVRDMEVKSELKAKDIPVHCLGADLLYEPWEVSKGQRAPLGRVLLPAAAATGHPAAAGVPATMRQVLLGKSASQMAASSLCLHSCQATLPS